MNNLFLRRSCVAVTNNTTIRTASGNGSACAVRGLDEFFRLNRSNHNDDVGKCVLRLILILCCLCLMNGWPV